jgi:hypothetical protein
MSAASETGTLRKMFAERRAQAGILIHETLRHKDAEG